VKKYGKLWMRGGNIKGDHLVYGQEKAIKVN
jgi:hypothetical protein